MKNKTLDVRYYGETHCKLSCKNCYLGFSDVGADSPYFDYTKYENISLNHYVNLQQTQLDTQILFYRDLDFIKQNFFNNSKQNFFYSLITDIATFDYLSKPKENFYPLLENLNPTFSLSFKKNNDLNYFLLPDYKTSQKYAFSFIHGLDKPEWFSKILNHCIETNNFLTLMFNKPITFSKESLEDLMNFYVKYSNVVTIDSCISKLINNFDCTKNENNPNFLDTQINIQSKSYYRCAYTVNSCIVSLDNPKFKLLTSNDIKYITEL